MNVSERQGSAAAGHNEVLRSLQSFLEDTGRIKGREQRAGMKKLHLEIWHDLHNGQNDERPTAGRVCPAVGLVRRQKAWIDSHFRNSISW
jgi:hypothetical protein